MIVKIDVSAEKLADLFTSAIEGGDPVTTAARGGWCDGIYWKRRKSSGDIWYCEPSNFANGFLIDIVEVDDERTGHITTHRIHQGHVATGLKLMAEKFPHQFGQIMQDNIDAPCADIFLQCCLFGAEKYA
ncbi:MAG TPA: hypothetical protein VGU72_04470 [Beijerinckiaceae bacterium]|jgi:hypothetical protein|nr:hypothetical protein [Beijerinckiaceae bacterium]